MRLHVLGMAALALAATSAARAQPGEPGAGAGQVEQTALNTAIAELRQALVAESSDDAVSRMRLQAAVELAGYRLELEEVLARAQLASEVARSVTRAAAQPTGQGQQARAALGQELSQATQQCIQAISQAGQQQAQAVGQATQRCAQEWGTSSQALTQDMGGTIQRMIQTLGPLGPETPAVEATVPDFEPAALPPDKDPAATCQAELEAARKAYLKALTDAKATAATEMEQALVQHAGDEVAVQKTMREAMKRLRVATVGALDAMELAWNAAVRKYALAAME